MYRLTIISKYSKARQGDKYCFIIVVKVRMLFGVCKLTLFDGFFRAIG